MGQNVCSPDRAQMGNSTLCARFFFLCIKPSGIILLFLLIIACAGCAPQSVTVEWTTATEEQTAGFNVFRADAPDGNYVKVNSQLIPASVDPLHGGKYQYQDTTADPARKYYYKLEEVQDNGGTTMYGPIAVQSSEGFDLPVWLTGLGLTTWLIGGIGSVIIGGLVFLIRRKND